MTMTYKIIDADSHVNPPPDFWQDCHPQILRPLAAPHGIRRGRRRLRGV